MTTNQLAPIQSSFNAMTDSLNRGMVAGTLGAPVDLATMALRPFGYSVDKPVGGSEWIGQKMQDAGMVSDTRRPMAELAAGFALPAGALIKTVIKAAKAASTARAAAQAAINTEKNLAGLSKAKENNTFVYDRADRSKGFGRMMGYPQQAGTPHDKLFSNFADQLKTPGALSEFREKILNRALSDPKNFVKDPVATTVLPFRGDMSIVIEAAGSGRTRVQVIKGGTPIAAARLDRGLLDSIGVHESVKGQKIGADLLGFIHDSKIGNVLEVPDRSPGFVKIQSELVKNMGH